MRKNTTIINGLKYVTHMISRIDITAYYQLVDIQKNVVDEGLYSDWEQINERYTLGAIAVKNYYEDEEMYQRLCDIFGEAIIYSEPQDN